MSDRKLTAHVKSAGCAAKLSPSILDVVLAGVPRMRNDSVLVGFDTSDDAGVYRISADCALVQTVDFFPPMVDDPYTFGAIAAANALSDVYAMGGRPITALSILAYPGKGDLDDLEKILAGGADKIHECGCVILGGHSINDDEIKFGYAVTGTVHPERYWTNTGARPGDALIFTKRIGTGVVATALKRGMAAQEHINAAIQSMVTLNRAAAEALASLDVHSCTDVTGFGLMGHSREMAMGSNVTIEIEQGAIRWLPGAIDYALAGAISTGLNNNRDFASSCVQMKTDIAPEIESLLYDPQTSGGLLVSLPENDAKTLMREFPAAYRIGRVLERQGKPIHIS